MSAGTQRKCVLASACCHAVLLGVLLVAPAFLTSKPKPVKPGVNLVSAASVEALLRGGTPAAAPAPPPPAPEPVVTPPQPTLPPPRQPEPEPVRPTPPVAKAVEPRPVEPPPKKAEPAKKAEPVKTASPKAAPKTETKTTQKTPPKKYALTRVSPSSASKSSTTSKSPQPSLKDDIAKSLDRIGNPGVPVRITAPGGASAGAVGDQYALLVRETYDRAWVDPSEVADRGAEVEVEVTILRSGEILAAKVVSRSGIGALDASVQKALDRVRRIPQGMPPSMPDKQKTYVISFNLRDRR